MTINKVSSCFLFLLLLGSIAANSIDTFSGLQSCGEPIFVENEIVIDFHSFQNCKWKIQTQPNRILALSLVHGDLEQALEFLTIHDGDSKNSPILSLENRIIHEVGLSRKEIPTTLYTTSFVAEIALTKTLPSPLQLRIQKAVNCPFNLGAESQCGRVVDDVSCYCATFTARSQSSQTTYCAENNMLLVALESLTEENAIISAWPPTSPFWTSGSDEANEGRWIWESTNKPIFPGYGNWIPGEPTNGVPNSTEDCLFLGYDSHGGWYDATCSDVYDAICEAHP